MKIASLAKQSNTSDAQLNILDASRLLEQLSPDWKICDSHPPTLYAKLQRSNYQEITKLVFEITAIAKSDDHHPIISFGYKHCEIEYTTHSSGGLSAKDFVCAYKIDQIGE